MNNLVMLPIIIPFIVGALLIMFAKHYYVQRVISSLTVIVLFAFSIYLALDVYENGMAILAVGGWQAPFGIVLVGDMFATMMVVLATLVALVCLFFSFPTMHFERERYYFYPFFFFLLTGVNGAFLTGDLFNLFVFLEVMLLSSYALMVMGGSKFQLRETFKYAVINVFSSMILLAAIAYVYGIAGTVNMAHLAERVSSLEQNGPLLVVAILFFIAFAIKGALFPLYFWLPRSYYGPPAAITALFGGLLTKVGVYAIIRVFSLIFNHDIAFTHQTLMLILAGFTMLLGVLGAVAQFNFKKILAFHIISQIGYMIMGLGIFTITALAGAIFFLAHNIIVKTGLILYAGATEKITGTNDLSKMGGLLKTHPILAWSFLVMGLSIAGIPPLSGFIGKYPLLFASFEEGHYLLAILALFVGLLTLFSMLKIFMNVFWGKQKHSQEQANTSIFSTMAPIFLLLILTVLLGLAAEPFYHYAILMATELLDPSVYIDAVLKE
ncbi:Na+/H+ antiporter subunit D [Alkalihalobacillus pseudalcaliphilus]|uniref:Na+/H+ antiporter subunit D n=1 Tax=Alkalihalobacillus pseudalcaliphilus TaxID=79884 RepID=UPI00064D856B|nr:Na+/H+ antiporter subunit D [Alkalihalobacillus pseudalcaliphilus]KMK77199.1 monovalent cation/H+ antiporter subunit D [Alkalihalobacillus pseudalcaliphilus]